MEFRIKDVKRNLSKLEVRLNYTTVITMMIVTIIAYGLHFTPFIPVVSIMSEETKPITIGILSIVYGALFAIQLTLMLKLSGHWLSVIDYKLSGNLLTLTIKPKCTDTNLECDKVTAKYQKNDGMYIEKTDISYPGILHHEIIDARISFELPIDKIDISQPIILKVFAQFGHTSQQLTSVFIIQLEEKKERRFAAIPTMELTQGCC